MSGEGEFKKYTQVSEAYKEIINSITTSEVGQLKLFFVNLEKKIEKKEGVYSEYASLKDMLDQFKQAKGKVPLHFAVARGDLEIVKFMIEGLKLDINVKDSEGNNPYFTAIEHGHFEMVRYFIEELNCSANATKEGDISVLHLASNHNYPEMMKYLIEKKADVERVSIYGKPINWAAGSSNVEAMRVLLANKADPNGDLTCPAPAPLILAIDFGNEDIFNLLFEYNADPQVKDPHGYSTLHVAAEKGNLKLVEDLVKRGVPVQYQVDGKSALYLAFEGHKFNVVNYLKQKSKNFQEIEKKINEMRSQQAKYEQNKEKASEIKQVGNKLYSENNYEAALEEYEKALEHDRDNTVIHRNMAACYLALKNFSDALHECQLAKVEEPKNVKTLYREAQAYVGLQNLIEAASSFWECSMLEPNNPLFKNEFQKYVNLAKKKHGK